jgi:ATP-dependent DNA helicase RecQ
VDNIYKYLSKLSSAQILHYIPRKTNPVVVFTEERLEDKALLISYDEYNKRRIRYVEKLEAILHYSSTSNKCRSQLLLGYFGEKNAYRCGQCDVCQKRNELDLSQYEFDLIVDDLKKQLDEGLKPLNDLIESVSEKYSQEKIIKVVRWLLDNHKMKYTNETFVEWVH